jgi:hypothetical protein
MWKRCLPLPFLLFLVTGCGPSWESTPFGTGPGYDVYRPEPYLLVLAAGEPREAGKGGKAPPTTQPIQVQYTAKITYLPDYSTRYRIKGEGSLSDAGLWMKDGWNLVGISTQDTGGQMMSSLISSTSTSPVVTGGLGVAGLVGDEPVSAGGSSPVSEAGAPGVAPTPNLGLLPGQHAIALYKIIYDSSGHVTGLVRVMPTADVASMTAKLQDNSPPPVPK